MSVVCVNQTCFSLCQHDIKQLQDLSSKLQQRLLHEHSAISCPVVIFVAACMIMSAHRTSTASWLVFKYKLGKCNLVPLDNQHLYTLAAFDFEQVCNRYHRSSAHGTWPNLPKLPHLITG